VCVSDRGETRGQSVGSPNFWNQNFFCCLGLGLLAGRTKKKGHNLVLSGQRKGGGSKVHGVRRQAGGLCSYWEGLEALVRMPLVVQDVVMRSFFVRCVSGFAWK